MATTKDPAELKKLIADSIARTQERKKKNERRAKNRKKGLKKLDLAEKKCKHQFKHLAVPQNSTIQYTKQYCPKCLRGRLTYYQARTKAAEGQLRAFKRTLSIILQDDAEVTEEVSAQPLA